MGVIRNAFLGPFLKCKPRDSANYLAIRELRENEFNESLYVLESCGTPAIEGFLCLAPNRRREHERSISCDVRFPDADVTEIGPHMIADERLWFSKQFAAEITAITKMCESAEIKWGLVFTAN